MSTHLLDVNVLLALCDPLHTNHDEAHRWFAKKAGDGEATWATCALTENGFVRVASTPSYPNALESVAAARAILRALVDHPGHTFWGCDLTIRDEGRLDFGEISSKALTDVYLLGLAVEKQGKLVTFDKKIPTHAVKGASKSLVLL